MAVFCGIDWAEGHHDVALVDGDGKLVAKRRIEETPDGFAGLTAMLADAGDSPEAPIPVAIETPRGLLVAALRATGRPVYPNQPAWRWPGIGNAPRCRGRRAIISTRWRWRTSLRTDAHRHRVLPADSALARSVTVLARAYQDAVWRRTVDCEFTGEVEVHWDDRGLGRAVGLPGVHHRTRGRHRR